MDDCETGILRANYNEHLKLHPCELYLLMVLAILCQNMLISPENSCQKKGHTHVYPKLKLMSRKGFQEDLKKIKPERKQEKNNDAFPARSGSASCEPNNFVIARQTEYLISCLPFWFPAEIFPVAEWTTSPMCSGNWPFGPSLVDFHCLSHRIPWTISGATESEVFFFLFFLLLFAIYSDSFLLSSVFFTPQLFLYFSQRLREISFSNPLS